MLNTQENLESGKSYVLLVVMTGIIIAAGAFFVAFVTTQKAQTPKTQNLRLAPIKIPTPPPVEPLLKKPGSEQIPPEVIPVESQTAAPSGVTSTPLVETSPDVLTPQ
ncbi:MAG: hypothetical protein UX13_C0036G0002 [Candidatus Woesebacteria bacterium GW2011_GWB1_45_5]|uniref:Uncharacterized protein n=1 Tax=Candidatus Woesebacteria bacterium GW2011_GWB1_45_5 TaxID=1618581 RepID=A0A0G1MN56_9BACT|nr:MAG: hypothetical protein UX13_C0036G0002 [Candidatus Woesebacteria bacterium GW2011_GWB1_45_5]